MSGLSGTGTGSDAVDVAAARLSLDDDARRRLQRRTLLVVVASQVLGGFGLAAGITVGALLAEQMLGSEGLAGVPTTLFTLGSALTAFLVGRVTQKRGRRTGLALGFAAGGLGAAGIVAAAAVDAVPLLLVSLFVYGAGTATNLLARYAGTDLAVPARRGTAISVAMVSTTLGAVVGPNLVEPLGRLAVELGLPALAGPFLLGGVAYLAAGTVLFALLRPDPLLVARRLERPEPARPERVAVPASSEVSATSEATASSEIAARADVAAGSAAVVPRPGVGAAVGATVMVLTQVAMVAIMTMTPVHMRHHHHDLGEIGLVISVHVGAMFLPSLVTGVLVDRVGRLPMAVAAAATLLLAGLTAAAAPGDSLGLLIVALALLGLGWNFGLISGTALVVDATVPANRARTQGSIDVLVALAGAGGGAASGLVMASTSYATLSLIGGALSLFLIPVLFWSQLSSRRSDG